MMCSRSMVAATRYHALALALALLVPAAAAEARPADPIARAAANTTIQGRVYEDRDAGGGGLRSGDAGLNGWRVWLDRNGNGRFDRGEPSTRTGSRGGRSGSYSLRVRARGGSASLRAGPASGTASRWRTAGRRCTQPSGCRWKVALKGGSSLGGKNFGWYQTATIAGVVYEDEDGNGKRDAAEFGLSGFRVWLDRDRDGSYDAGEPSDQTTSTSGPSGIYEITGVKPSAASAPLRHTPTIDLGINWACTQPTTSDEHGCFSTLRPRSGDRIQRDIGDRQQEVSSTPTTAPRPQPLPPGMGGLHVAATVINDDGGSLTQSGIQVRVLTNGLDVVGSPQQSSPEGVSFTLPAGTYQVSVGGARGYASSGSGDCDINGTVVVSAGFTASCTGIVNDIAPTLTVITNVVNDNGLTAGPEAFLTRVKVASSGAEIPGSPKPGSASGATFTLRADSPPYQVSQDPGLHYTTSYSGQCLVQPSLGERKTCTVTNNDIAAPGKPIQGTWSLSTAFLGTWRIAVTQDSPYVFTGTITSSPACPSLEGQQLFSQATEVGTGGLQYTVPAPYYLYNNASCGDAVGYGAQITLTDSNQGSIQPGTSVGPQQLVRVTQCNDDTDNDADDDTDFPADSGCTGPFDNTE
jgi:hypothetical protein